MTGFSAKTFLFQNGCVHVPIFMLVKAILLLTALIVLITGRNFWHGSLFNAAFLVAIFGLFTLVEIFRYGPLGRPMLFLSEQELIIPKWNSTNGKECRIYLKDVTDVQVRGPYEMRLVRFAHHDGSTEEVPSFWWRGYGDRVIACLQQVLAEGVKVRIEPPPTFMERLRSED